METVFTVEAGVKYTALEMNRIFFSLERNGIHIYGWTKKDIENFNNQFKSVNGEFLRLKTIQKHFKVIIEKDTKFSNGCEWYKNGQIYEVYEYLGCYIVNKESSICSAIQKTDAKIV
jgi:hypothetical protein